MTRCGQPCNDAPLPFMTRSQPSWCPMMISGTWSLLMSARVGDELRFQRLVLIVHAAVVVTAPAGWARAKTPATGGARSATAKATGNRRIRTGQGTSPRNLFHIGGGPMALDIRVGAKVLD